jgi:RimJ/RimL family protein N-acetyltransferase
LRLVTGFDAVVAQWVADRIPGVDDFGPCSAIGVADKDQNLVAGVVFHDYQPQWGNIQVSFAADRSDWLTPGTVQAIMRYAFNQLACLRITTLTPKRNKRARQFLLKFGFRVEGNVRNGFGDDDCIISGLLRSEWQAHRFNRQRVSKSA